MKKDKQFSNTVTVTFEKCMLSSIRKRQVYQNAFIYNVYHRCLCFVRVIPSVTFEDIKRQLTLISWHICRLQVLYP